MWKPRDPRFMAWLNAACSPVFANPMHAAVLRRPFDEAANSAERAALFFNLVTFRNELRQGEKVRRKYRLEDWVSSERIDKLLVQLIQLFKVRRWITELQQIAEVGVDRHWGLAALKMLSKFRSDDDMMELLQGHSQMGRKRWFVDEINAAMSKLRAREAAERFKETVTSRAPKLQRASAAIALGKLHEGERVLRLVARTEAAPTVLAAAITALGNFNSDETRELLVETLKAAKGARVRKAAVAALAQQGPEIVPIAAAMLDLTTSSPRVATDFAEVLVRIGRALATRDCGLEALLVAAEFGGRRLRQSVGCEMSKLRQQWAEEEGQRLRREDLFDRRLIPFVEGQVLNGPRLYWAQRALQVA